jgi:hypothetical protein
MCTSKASKLGFALPRRQGQGAGESRGAGGVLQHVCQAQGEAAQTDPAERCPILLVSLLAFLVQKFYNRGAKRKEKQRRQIPLKGCLKFACFTSTKVQILTQQGEAAQTDPVERLP